jgi:hypothetical protein
MSFQAYLDTIKEKTGLGPQEFRELAAAKSLLEPGVKTSDITNWLEEDFGLGRGHAMAIVATFRERPAAGERVDKQFIGAKAAWRSTFDSLLASLRSTGEVDLAPTDTYISLVKPTSKQPAKFAIVAVTAGRLDVGIKLRSAEATGRFEPAGAWNSMVTHRVRITDPAQLDTELLEWLRRAYDAA